MRRLLVALVALVGAGLLTAQAADVSPPPVALESFSSSVSISVPDTTTTTEPCAPVALDQQLFVRTAGGVRVLDPAPAEPPANDGFTTRTLSFANAPIESEADGNQYLVWRTGSAPPCGWTVAQPFVLTVRVQFTPLLTIGTPRLRARLFSCPATAADPSTSCIPLAQTGPGTTVIPTSFDAGVSIDLGTVTGSVPAGSQLRLKLIAEANGFNLLDIPTIRWGHTGSYKSQLNATATT